MMKLYGVILLLLSYSTLAANDFTLYLVRHAEKQGDSINPQLTACGSIRAEQLATILSKEQIKKIYSTAYKRTMATAAPLAKNKKLIIDTYDPQKLDAFALRLKTQKQTALIVGHSNTTPQLAALLTNKKVSTVTSSANEKNDLWLAPLGEDDYQMLYQIHFLNDETKLTQLIQPLNCRVVVEKSH